MRQKVKTSGSGWQTIDVMLLLLKYGMLISFAALAGELYEGWSFEKAVLSVILFEVIVLNYRKSKENER